MAAVQLAIGQLLAQGVVGTSYEINGVTYQWREGTKGAFQTIPTGLVRNANGEEVK